MDRTLVVTVEAEQREVANVNNPTRILKCLWLLAFLLAGLGRPASAAEIATADDLKDALHDLLSHQNLFDLRYLSNKLNIELHISPAEARDNGATRFVGTATKSPSLFYGYFEYSADIYTAQRESWATISFGSRKCGWLQQWGSEWNLKIQTGTASDGAIPPEWIVWPGNKGIALSLTPSRIGCIITMSQRLKRIVKVPVSPVRPLVSPDRLLQQIADLLLSDLRDYTQLGRILNTEFIVAPDSQKNGLLYQGRPSLGRVIPGFTPDVFYDGADSGWYYPASFFLRPLHIGDRTVSLDLRVDREVTCLSAAQLASDFGRRDPRIKSQRSADSAGIDYFVRGANLISVTVRFENQCATALRFRQVTDVSQSFGGFIRFTPKESLDSSTGTLTTEARRRIGVIKSRVLHLSLMRRYPRPE